MDRVLRGMMSPVKSMWIRVLGGVACDLLTGSACVVAAGEAVLMAVCVEAVGIATPAAWAGLVADELRVV
jgi:hypothetical protein